MNIAWNIITWIIININCKQKLKLSFKFTIKKHFSKYKSSHIQLPLSHQQNSLFNLATLCLQMVDSNSQGTHHNSGNNKQRTKKSLLPNDCLVSMCNPEIATRTKHTLCAYSIEEEQCSLPDNPFISRKNKRPLLF